MKREGSPKEEKGRNDKNNHHRRDRNRTRNSAFPVMGLCQRIHELRILGLVSSAFVHPRTYRLDLVFPRRDHRR